MPQYKVIENNKGEVGTIQSYRQLNPKLNGKLLLKFVHKNQKKEDTKISIGHLCRKTAINV